jgi:hypothetical protein
VFVQLLSETPGRRFKGCEFSYVALQHERAVAAGKAVLQWRSRQPDMGSEEIPADHRQRLNGVAVAATDLSEFKSLVVDTVKKLVAPPPPARDHVARGDPDKLVFVDAEEPDLEAAQIIGGFFKELGIATMLPVQGATPEATRKALKTLMLACDGMVLVHGNNPDWPVHQWTHFRKVKAEREDPIRAIGLCDLPPPQKATTVDFLHLPSAHVIDCRDGLAADKFASFLRAL